MGTRLWATRKTPKSPSLLGRLEVCAEKHAEWLPFQTAGGLVLWSDLGFGV